VIRLLQGKGLLEENRTRLLLSWRHSGFSVHNAVTVPPGDGRAPLRPWPDTACVAPSASLACPSHRAALAWSTRPGTVRPTSRTHAASEALNPQPPVPEPNAQTDPPHPPRCSGRFGACITRSRYLRKQSSSHAWCRRVSSYGASSTGCSRSIHPYWRAIWLSALARKFGDVFSSDHAALGRVASFSKRV
jgi:hypothetical protein